MTVLNWAIGGIRDAGYDDGLALLIVTLWLGLENVGLLRKMSLNRSGENIVKRQGREQKAVPSISGSTANLPTQQLVSTIVESACDPIIVASPSLHVQYANPSACQALGMTQTQFIGMYLGDAFPARVFRQMKKNARTVFSSGKPLTLKEWLPQNGQDRWMDVRLTPLKGPDGRTEAVLAVCRDITDYERARTELIESNALLRNICGRTAQLICVKDRQGRVIMANPAMLRFIGRSKSQVIGKSDLAFVADAAQAARIMKNDRRIMRTKSTETVEETGSSPNGPWICLTSKSPYVDAHGNVLGVMGIGMDITERKRAEEALRRSEAARAMHARITSAREEERRRVSHELHDSVGQKLVVARLKTKELVEKESAGRAPSLATPLADLYTQLGELCEEVRQVGRSIYPFVLEAQGLAAALRQMARDCESARTRLTVRCDEAGESVRFARPTEIALYRITQEALANALRHGKPRSVSMTLNCAKGQVRLTIADNGRGFCPEKATKRGLGLVSMEERAKAIGATFRVSSKPGRTSVQVRLAAKASDVHEPAKRALPGLGGRALDRSRRE